MLKYIAIFLFFNGFWFLACGTSNPSQNEAASRALRLDSLENRVMFLHDSVMPETSELMRYKRNFQEKAAATTDSLVATPYLEAAMQLESAYHLMMDWMQAYHAPDTQSSLEAQEAYLMDELMKIQEVVEAHKAAMDVARSLDAL